MRAWVSQRGPRPLRTLHAICRHAVSSIFFERCTGRARGSCGRPPNEVGMSATAWASRRHAQPPSRSRRRRAQIRRGDVHGRAHAVRTSHALRRRQVDRLFSVSFTRRMGEVERSTPQSTGDTRADLRSYCYNTSKHAYIGVRGTRTIRPPESLLIVEHAHNILISFPTLALLALSLSVVAFTGQKYELHVTRYRPEGGRLSCAC